MTRRDETKQLVLLFICALAFRLLLIHQGANSPFFQNLIIDAEKYSSDAIKLMQGSNDSYLTTPFWQAPGYTLYLCFIYFLFGLRNLLAVRVIQALLDSFNCILVVTIAKALGIEWRWSFLSGCLLAAYGPSIFFTTEIAIPIPLIFGMLMSTRLLLHLIEKPSPYVAVAIGLILGLSALFRPNALVLGLPFVIFIFRYFEERADAAKWTVFFVVGILIAVLPVSVHNFRRGGEFILISHNGGINLFVGNNPDWKTTFNIRPGPAWERMVSEPSRSVGPYRGISSSKASGYWVRRVTNYAWNEPYAFMKGMLEKCLLFVNYYEFRRNTDIEFQKSILPMLRYPILFTFGFIGPLALVGLVFYIRSGKMWLPAFIVLIYSTSIIIFFVCGRYRLPIVPLLCIFASLGIKELYEQREYPHTFMPRFLVLFIAIIVVHGDYVSGIDKTPAESFVYLSRWAKRDKDDKGAKMWAELALKTNPKDPQVRDLIGKQYQEDKEYDKALEHYEAILKLEPHNYVWRKNLGFVYLEQQKIDKAEREFQLALADAPKLSDAYRGLGYVAMARKEYEQAEHFFNIASQFKQEDIGAKLGVVRALILQNENRKAMDELQHIIKQDPKFGAARRDLGYLLFEAKAYADARYQFSNWKPRKKEEEAERCFLLGMCNDKLNDRQRAMDCFKKAVMAGHTLHPDILKKYRIGLPNHVKHLGPGEGMTPKSP